MPLRLEWEPYYAVPEGMDVKVGDRVKVHFAHKPYTAVVSRCDVEPITRTDKILLIDGPETGLPAIGEMEIAFWRHLAHYYLCSVGEVYKAAYPSMKIQSEETQVRKKARLEELQTVLRQLPETLSV